MGSMERTGSGRVFWRRLDEGGEKKKKKRRRGKRRGNRGGSRVGKEKGQGRGKGTGEENEKDNENEEGLGQGQGEGQGLEKGQEKEGMSLKRVLTSTSLSSMSSMASSTLSVASSVASSHSSRGGLNPRAPSYAFVSSSGGSFQGSRRGQGQRNVDTSMNRSSTSISPVHLTGSYSQFSSIHIPLYSSSQRDQADEPSTSHFHAHPDPQPSHQQQQQSQVVEFTFLITEIIPGYHPPHKKRPFPFPLRPLALPGHPLQPRFPLPLPLPLLLPQLPPTHHQKPSKSLTSPSPSPP